MTEINTTDSYIFTDDTPASNVITNKEYLQLVISDADWDLMYGRFRREDAIGQYSEHRHGQNEDPDGSRTEYKAPHCVL
jgi:hypothetical protein